ncbi:MAG: DEAD/DEAH box helicase [Candidatus Parcubacteria bacterium]|nr:DEAD/DEAH box helicase [Candidatus Paceibacterota bacterium]
MAKSTLSKKTPSKENALDNFQHFLSMADEEVEVIAGDTRLIITLENRIKIPKVAVIPELWQWIQTQLTIANSQYLMLQRLGKSTWKTPPEFILYQYDSQYYYLPRGFLGELLKYCQHLGLEFELIDNRIKRPDIEYTSNIELRKYQSDSLERIAKYHFGVIVAPPGSGKTVMGLELVARCKQPTLILVHRKELLDQWVERAVSFLGIDKKDIGIVGSGKKKWGQKLTVATIQTLHTMLDELPELSKQFGLVIVDECHHIPANTFGQVIELFNPFYMYGLTATPQRKNNDEKMIFTKVGQIIITINPFADDHYGGSRPKPRIHIKETTLHIPFDYTQDTFELLNKVVICDTTRNQMIVKDILKEVKNGKKILVLTERKDHVELLNLYLRDFCDIVPLTGDDNKTLRNKKLTQVRSDDFDVLIATGQLMGEGVDISNLDCLFLVYPFSFEGKLIQYIGRIQRTKNEQVIYDYRDVNIPFLEKQFKKRYAYYSEL